MIYRQIIDIRDEDKYVEFWFQDGNRDPRKCDSCCRWSALTAALNGSGQVVREHILRHGYVGLWVAIKEPVKLAATIIPVALATRITGFMDEPYTDPEFIERST